MINKINKNKTHIYSLSVKILIEANSTEGNDYMNFYMN